MFFSLSNYVLWRFACGDVLLMSWVKGKWQRICQWPRISEWERTYVSCAGGAFPVIVGPPCFLHSFATVRPSTHGPASLKWTLSKCPQSLLFCFFSTWWYTQLHMNGDFSEDWWVFSDMAWFVWSRTWRCLLTTEIPTTGVVISGNGEIAGMNYFSKKL